MVIRITSGFPSATLRTGSSAMPFLLPRSGPLRACDFFVSCDSVVPLKRDSNHLSSLPGIPLPLHAGLLSCVPAGTLPRRQHEIVCRIKHCHVQANGQTLPLHNLSVRMTGVYA